MFAFVRLVDNNINLQLMNKIFVIILITLTIFSCQQKEKSKFSAISRVDSLKKFFNR